jgi:hypothetical protein
VLWDCEIVVGHMPSMEMTMICFADQAESFADALKSEEAAVA